MGIIAGYDGLQQVALDASGHVSTVDGVVDAALSLSLPSRRRV